MSFCCYWLDLINEKSDRHKGGVWVAAKRNRDWDIIVCASTQSVACLPLLQIKLILYL